MLTSCWSRDISKRGLIKLPPCEREGGGGGGEEGGFRREGDRRGTTRQNLRDLGVRLDFIVPKVSKPDPSQAADLLNFNKPISNTLQLLGHVESREEGRKDLRGKGVSMTVNGGECWGRIRKMEILKVVRWVFSFFLDVGNYFVIGRQV